MTQTPELLPCPVCGKEPKRNGRLGAGGVICMGTERGLQHRLQTYGATQADADVAWNTRSHAIHEPASVMREEAAKVGNDALCRLIEDMCPERNDLGYPIGPQVEALAAAIRNLPLSDGVG